MNPYIDTYRDGAMIEKLFDAIHKLSKDLEKPLKIMEVCGGHTHTIMKYALPALLPKNIEFVHGPGCPVCIMPKERIDCAYKIASQKDVILVTLGDMIKVPGSFGSLQKARSEGKQIQFVYSPLEAIKIAQDHPNHTIVFFAIGFETTTPMTAALLDKVIELGLKNVLFHINHVLVPPPLHAILQSPNCQINALLAPSHVSVITGSEIYEPFASQYKIPIVVCGFEPVDVGESLLSLVKQAINKEAKVQTQYARSVTKKGNIKAQELIKQYFTLEESFTWRGLGSIAHSSWKLKEEFANFDASLVYAQILQGQSKGEHKACLCGEILKGNAKPYECKLFGKACTPQNPLGSCMVSSEGACAAYYKYGGNAPE